MEGMMTMVVGDLAREIAGLSVNEFSGLCMALRQERRLTPERPPHRRDLIDVMDEIAEVQAEIRQIMFPAPPASAPLPLSTP